MKILFKSNKQILELFPSSCPGNTGNWKQITIPNLILFKISISMNWLPPTKYEIVFHRIPGSSVNYLINLINSFFGILKRLYIYFIIYRDSKKNLKSKNFNQKNKSCFFIISDWLEPIYNRLDETKKKCGWHSIYINQ